MAVRHGTQTEGLILGPGNSIMTPGNPGGEKFTLTNFCNFIKLLD